MPRSKLSITVGGLAVLLGALDAYVLVSILVDIVSDFDVPVNHLERATPLITGYLLGYIAGMPLLGRLSDRYGRRLVILLCLFGFGAGSIVTATSATMTQLIAGRALQGLAGGALLPVTMALVADVFSAERRAAALGWVGAAQELGAVLGPLFGAAVAAWIGWRGIFWINVPLTVLAAIAVWFMVPKRTNSQAPRVAVVGGLLLALSLALLVIGLYNPEPDKSVLPSWGLACVGGGVVALALFVFWEARSGTRLMETTNVRMRPFLAALVASLCAGAALLITLVDVQLVAQTLMGKTSWQGTLMLTRFLVALPVGAVVGGLLIRLVGERFLAFIGLLGAGVAYWLIANWPAGVSQQRIDVDLIVAGLGLGLVIAPLSAVVLRVVPASQHGIASASLVVARMMGMLIGVAALSAWGLHRFQVLGKDVPLPQCLTPATPDCKPQWDAYQLGLQNVLRTEYREIFLATAAICVLGALFGLVLGGRRLAARAEQLG